MSDRYAPTPRTRIRRLPKRAAYDHAAVHAVLDAGVLCHVGYVIDGQPYVTPTLYWRHGAAPLLARLVGQPDAAPPEGGGAGLRDGVPSGRLRAGALGLSSLGQLPRGDGARPRAAGAGRGQARRARGLRRAPAARAAGRSCARRRARRSRPPRCLWMELEEVSAKIRTGHADRRRGRTTRCRSGRA